MNTSRPVLTPEKLAAARSLVNACPAGPWSWYVRPKSHAIRIEAPEGTFGPWFETVADFARWGMNSAAPRFRRFDPAADEPGEMERADAGSVPFPGREHHARWARTIVHPVGRLMVEARTIIPELLDEIERLRAEMDRLRGQAANQVLRLLDEIGELQANAAKWRELGPWYAIKDDRVPSPTGYVDSCAGVPWVSNSREQMRGGCLLPVSEIVEYTGAENQ